MTNSSPPSCGRVFVPNVFSFASEGRLFRYGSIRMPIGMWGPWRDHENQQEGQLHHVKATELRCRCTSKLLK
jgi:type I restriction enzyme R subunit